MTPPIPDRHISEIDDAEFARVWRARALHGDKEAFGLAHALESEQRRRSRVRNVDTNFMKIAPAPARPWWKFWSDSPNYDQR